MDYSDSSRAGMREQCIMTLATALVKNRICDMTVQCGKGEKMCFFFSTYFNILDGKHDIHILLLSKRIKLTVCLSDSCVQALKTVNLPDTEGDQPRW